MKNCFMTFRSITPAQKAQRVFSSAGITCTLQRTPRWMEAQGCGYSLRLRRQDVYSAVTLCKSNAVEYRRIYLKNENDSFEEVHL